MPGIGLIWSIIWGGFSKFVGALFNFFTTKPGVYVGIFLLAVGALWYADHRGYTRGYGDKETEYKIAEAKAVEAAFKRGAEIQKELDKSLADISYARGLEKGRAESHTVTLIKKVPQYVPIEVDRDFRLPCGLLRLHDASALGITPEAVSLPAGLADGEACPVKASLLATVIVENYGIDHQKDAQILGLQDVVRTLSAIVSGGN